jgi:RNA polymerase sigma factor (sigma-70 family)
MTEEERNRTIDAHAGLVRSVARAFVSRLPPCFDLDDLVQEGFIGLIDAADKYDPGLNVPFAAYAFYRVRGAICSSVRRSQWANSTMASIFSDGGELMFEPTSSAPDHDGDLNRETRGRQLRAALAEHLTPRERFVVELYFFEGETLLEAGKRLGVNNSRASQINHKALQKLAALDELRSPS